ncbi:hypothetical protein CGRA01v4_15075 [Colletotrichum graminicola]|uniref:Uncharacterized protein n=1 Tax=Colletotrichum graminicola (strain M1.001 / M2 / FGSC 10212) TaxID=645133 RepID=E3R0H2_COLGM|nr:uncharacterized protein GLRG_11755 [Colletotrichum graminicola M1.001]EFQ36610.1 hypothetical protein GLRG_11755 [Colletotrichum graminicola M1.001]WDK23783.1 hypothetical protein CGRA01v4_15075 [Colletotrichum graminicola]
MDKVDNAIATFIDPYYGHLTPAKKTLRTASFNSNKISAVSVISLTFKHTLQLPSSVPSSLAATLNVSPPLVELRPSATPS